MFSGASLDMQHLFILILSEATPAEKLSGEWYRVIQLKCRDRKGVTALRSSGRGEDRTRTRRKGRIKWGRSRKTGMNQPNRGSQVFSCLSCPFLSLSSLRQLKRVCCSCRFSEAGKMDGATAHVSVTGLILPLPDMTLLSFRSCRERLQGQGDRNM